MLEVSPVSRGFVVQINNVDVGNLSDAEFEEIYSAWLDHGVLRIKKTSILAGCYHVSRHAST